MTFKEIVEKNYNEWKRYVNSKGYKAYNGKTGEDILQDVLLTATKKFAKKKASEEDIISYIKLNLVRELDCLPKKINKKEIKISDIKKSNYACHREDREEED